MENLRLSLIQKWIQNENENVNDDEDQILILNEILNAIQKWILNEILIWILNEVLNQIINDVSIYINHYDDHDDVDVIFNENVNLNLIWILNGDDENINYEKMKNIINVDVNIVNFINNWNLMKNLIEKVVSVGKRMLFMLIGNCFLLVIDIVAKIILFLCILVLVLFANNK